MNVKMPTLQHNTTSIKSEYTIAVFILNEQKMLQDVVKKKKVTKILQNQNRKPSYETVSNSFCNLCFYKTLTWSHVLSACEQKYSHVPHNVHSILCEIRC